MITKEIKLGGRTLTLETGRMAKQADGSVLARYGDTMVLASAVSEHEQKVGFDYFPLMVEYRERHYAAGKIPGGFFKREGRPSEKEVLSARLTDRAIRPLFPDGYKCDTQVIIYIISSDTENDADVLGTIAASAALSISDIPFAGPIASVRVGLLDGELILNPLHSQLVESTIDIVVTGGKDSLIMVEGKFTEVPESRMLEALSFGHEAIKDVTAMIDELTEEAGKDTRVFEIPQTDPELLKEVRALAEGKVREAARMSDASKHERANFTSEFTKEIIESLQEKYPEEESSIKEIIHDIESEVVREMIITEGIRLDGRGPKEIRPITCEVGILPRAHGSALFTRGETQSLTAATLGTKMDEQRIDGIDGQWWSNYMLHYNFPPFSVGEVRPIRGTSRREVGHGKLAERAISAVIPDDDFPYTLRLVSDILESNGSSSMATVCAGSLALMDAGVNIRKPVAGIAMGLITDGKKTVVISDILGAEDHMGDMDFKLAGTRDGVTAVQMDLKIGGIDMETMAKAIEQAREGRLHILDEMDSCISEARPELSKYAPRICKIQIPVEKIGEIIGPGGKNIRRMIAESGAEINVDDDGMVYTSSIEGDGAEIARDMIAQYLIEPEEGKEYDATVVKIMDFGAFVEFLPGKEGLVHISELEYRRVNKVEDVLKVGDEVRVKLYGITPEGKYDLSRKALLEKPEGWVDKPRTPKPPRRDGGRPRDGRNRGSGRDKRNR